MDINQLREKIDNIDDQILILFLERMKCAEKIGKIKKAQGINVFDKSRETQILERLCKKSGEYQKEVEKLFSCIMEISKHHQRSLL